ncbi:hypothetical protein GCM10009710_31100 [Aeromicrobium alkaliterrae]|uniref:Uncharacterized protein n=2 Tax=Aeromicrobium alkaliterrae TaxID=302168 RepID=A0ABP4W9T3_9ACTN
MDLLAHYVRIHLTGAAAGIELFGRGSDLDDEDARQVAADIREELREERTWLLAFADTIDAAEPVVAETVAKIGEKVGRLKPNGDLLHRTPLTDVIDLETMHDAVSGKVAGWEALLQLDDEQVDRADLERLLAQGHSQLDRLRTLHRSAARRAWDARTA